MRRIFIGIIIIAWITKSFSQEQGLSVYNKITGFPSPNVASLGIYGNIPVSPYTGTPNIEIPLHEIDLKGYKVPMSLQYHSGSIKPDQHPGWVGLGWSLNIGGVIYRTINGFPDDYSDFINNNVEEGRGFYATYSVLDKTNWNSSAYLRGVAQNEDYTKPDTEPDEFSFQFLNYSGKFYIDHKGKWNVLCNKPIRVEFDDTYVIIPTSIREQVHQYPIENSRFFSGFTLIDEKGVKYVFGKDISAIEFTKNFFYGDNHSWFASAWYLTKIIYPNNVEVKFSYERGDYTNQMYNAYSYLQYTGTYDGYGCSFFSNSLIYKGEDGFVTSAVYLDKISYIGGEIYFNRSKSEELRISKDIYALHHKNNPTLFDNLLQTIRWKDGIGYTFYQQDVVYNNLQWYKLDSIFIQTNNDEEEYDKIIRFNYTDNSQSRLILNSVENADFFGNNQKYSFEYNAPENLPEYMSYKTDYWGFYNANEYGNSMVMLNNVRGREANPSVATIGQLTKITYPTGGYTKFEFEPHTISKRVKINRWEGCDDLHSNEYVGGVRIKRIITSPTGKSTDEYIDKTYYYCRNFPAEETTSSLSSGVLASPLKYNLSNYTAKAYNRGNSQITMSIKSYNSLLPASVNTHGSHVTYTRVIEKHADNSYTVYHYTNFDTGHQDEQCDQIINPTQLPYSKFNSLDQQRGLLDTLSIFDANGTIKRKTVNNYVKDKISDNYVRSIAAAFYNICPDPDAHYDEGCAYRIYTYTMLPSKVTEFVYDVNGPVVTSTQYTYNGKKQIVSRKITNSANELYEDKTSYASDISNGIPGSVYTDMVQRNMISYPVEQIRYKNYQVIAATLNTYKRNSGSIVASEIYKATIENPFTGMTFFNGAGMDNHYLSPELIFTKYDDMNNVLETIDRDGVVTTYQWGYGGMYLVGIFRNAQNGSLYKDTFYEDFEEGSNSSVAGFHSRRGHVGAYTVSLPINPSKQYFIDYYVYNRRRWQYKREIFTGSKTISEGSNPIDNVRVYPQHATVITCSYIPHVGMTSRTDEKGQTESYEYDTVGRLTIIRNTKDQKTKEYEYHYRPIQ